VRRSIRMLTMSAVVVGTLGAFVGGSAVAASAQTTGDTAEQCVVLSPAPPLPAGAVQVKGTAPIGSTVQFFDAAGTAGPTAVTDGSGNFLINVSNSPGQYSVNFTLQEGNGYASGCVDPAADVVVKPVSVTTPAATAAALAFTGSSETSTYVLVGLAALVLGTVLIVAARRRSHVTS